MGRCSIIFNDWIIDLFIIIENVDINAIIDKLKELECPPDIIDKAIKRIMQYENSGFTYSNKQRSIIVINKPESIEEFVDTYNHEKNHVEMCMCKEYGIDPYSEEAAYLSGNLAKKIFRNCISNLLR